MRKLWMAIAVLTGLALAGCQSAPAPSPSGGDSKPGDAGKEGGGQADAGKGGADQGSASQGGSAQGGSGQGGAGSGGSGTPPAGSSFAGTWELDIVADSKPHLVLQVAADNSAKLLSEAGFDGKQYESIRFSPTDAGVNVVVEEIQPCGNRTVTYTMVKSGDGFTGAVAGPNANCRPGTFQSPPGSVKLERRSAA